jgi:hypothetical protein
MALLQRYTRPVGYGLILAGLMFLAYLFVVVAPQTQTFHHDAFAYWNVGLPEPYDIPWLELGSFNYAPPVALVFDWFDTVDWWVFSWLWMMLLVGSVIWMGWSPVWILAALAFPPVALELYGGNIHILLPVAVVLGFRHPWMWSFVLLTKPSAGVGLLWFVVRREWRELGIALGSTAVLCVVSFLLLPSLWSDWVNAILDNLGTPAPRNAIDVPLWLRLIAAALLVIWGARTDRRWTVVVASMVALPALWFGSFAMLIGVIPELRRRSLAAQPETATSSEVPG